MGDLKFIYGFTYHTYDGRKIDTNVTVVGVIEISNTQQTLILDDAKSLIKNAIAKHEIQKTLGHEERPNLRDGNGRGWREFFATFFSKDISNKEFVNELNVEFQKQLSDIFKS